MVLSIPKSHHSSNFIALAANILEYYDQGLYSLTAALLFTQFFGNCNPFTALIILFLPFEILAKPLGALFFGRIGDLKGRKKSFFLAILGMSLTTATIGFLPTYETIGIFSAASLVVLRILQKFCHSGNTGGALLLLESPIASKRNFLSSLYGASGIFGFILASFATFILAHFSLLEKYWRVLFLLGSLGGLIIFFAKNLCEETLFIAAKKIQSSLSLWKDLKQNFSALFAVIFVCSFSYTTYSIPFVMMNGFAPQISALSHKEILHINTILLCIDMLLLPVFGLISYKIPKEKMMRSAAYVALFGAIPVFSLLANPSASTIFYVRFFVVVVGVWFSATYYIWVQERVPVSSRYTIISLGKSFGGAAGSAATSISLWFYEYSHSHLTPAFYLLITAGFALIALRKKRTYEKTVPV
ncbi:MAG: MFS transporter [Chlamydiae bacterium]|nr:MFS transporter [Chlamydiota bacterium]